MLRRQRQRRRRIVEMWAQSPTMSLDLHYTTCDTDPAVGPFQLFTGGFEINWRPKHVTPYSVDCVAVNQFGTDLDCQAEVESQSFRMAQACGAMRGRAEITYKDGSARTVALEFATSVAPSEQQVTF